MLNCSYRFPAYVCVHMCICAHMRVHTGQLGHGEFQGRSFPVKVNIAVGEHTVRLPAHASSPLHLSTRFSVCRSVRPLFCLCAVSMGSEARTWQISLPSYRLIFVAHARLVFVAATD